MGDAPSMPKSLTEYAEETVRKGCLVCDLPTDTVAQIDEAPTTMTARTIQRWLHNEHGVRISHDTVGRHRRGHPAR